MVIKKKRSCDGCTECCKGWLSGEAHGKPFYPGKPCHFVSEIGCSIYKNRPHNPCVTFSCGWLQDSDFFPEWLKPSIAKIIARKLKTTNGIEFYRIHECGQKIDSIVLNYLILASLNSKINIQIQVNGGWTDYGSPEFLQASKDDISTFLKI